VSVLAMKYTCVEKQNVKNDIWSYKRKRRYMGRYGTWGIKTNDTLDELIRHKNIINYIKAQRLSWFGYLHRMPEERMVKML